MIYLCMPLSTRIQDSIFAWLICFNAFPVLPSPVSWGEQFLEIYHQAAWSVALVFVLRTRSHLSHVFACLVGVKFSLFCFFLSSSRRRFCRQQNIYISHLFFQKHWASKHKVLFYSLAKLLSQDGPGLTDLQMAPFGWSTQRKPEGRKPLDGRKRTRGV